MKLMTIENTEEEKQQAALALLFTRYESARKMRSNWESLWQECYDYALPQQGGFLYRQVPGAKRTDQIFDATAMDAADQLAASLLGNLTPIWSQWFGLRAGPDLTEEEAQKITPVLEKAARVIQDHFDRSNFSVEIHQCYLDLVVGGTASLSFEESDPGNFSAFRFSAIPLSNVVLEEGESGFLDGAFRTLSLTASQIRERYIHAVLPADIEREALRDPQARFKVIEAVIPDGLVYIYKACLVEKESEPVLLAEGRFDHSPFISFRWLKSPGEIYGRSPVMKALPDIKTANKVVELILKNASIAVTGIWQADDDGILNPANIELVPGSIIPKAVGSQGLQPLTMPSNFDVSQLMLDNLQARIRHALLADRMMPVDGPRMTATEVLERSAEMTMLLGATYGRLQAELLTPLVKRAYAILRRRGEVPDIPLDGRLVMVDYRSPLARVQAQKNVQNTLSWIGSVTAMGAEASGMVDFAQTAKFLGETLGVPGHLIRRQPASPLSAMAPLAQMLTGGGQDV